MQLEARTLEPALDAVRRRLAVLQTARAVTIAALAATGLAAIVRTTGGSLASALAVVLATTAGIACGSVLLRSEPRSRGAAARAIERVRPECRNVVITAEELLRHPDRAQPWMRTRVQTDAAAHVHAVSSSRAVPLVRSVAAAAAALAVAIAATTTVPQRVVGRARATLSRVGGPDAAATDAGRLTVVLQPPAYAGSAVETLTDPERVTAVEGTRARLTIGGGGTWRVRFMEDVLSVRQDAGATTAELVLRQTGYLAIESPREGNGARRLIPIVVTPDRAPAIRIETPGRDLLLPAARPVAVTALATDDFGLSTVSLRYTKVSGSGEQFEFVEGELPIAVAREDGRTWRARGRFPLAALGLEPGDSLVYRVTAQDARGSGGFASSDTFFIEIAGPGTVALEGFEMPPDRERHALSQQMIVLKIERLRARERALEASAVREQAAAIAAEQRSVRANFIFLMGGHVEDEEEEAEHSNEIQEGRLENTARREVSRAVGHMTYAEQALSAIDTAVALREARAAVEALQRAFGRNRYLLRTLPVRSQVDPSRRLSGKLEEAGDWQRSVVQAPMDRERAATRELLSALIGLADRLRDPRTAVSASGELTALAEQALRAGPGDARWQQIAERVIRLRDATAAGAEAGVIDRRLREALDPIVSRARESAASVTDDASRPSRLRSAWTEERHR